MPDESPASVALDALARALAPHIAREVVALLRSAETPGMVDQTRSILGRRRHAAFARRLIGQGDPDACQVGRRFLVRVERVEAHARELSAREPKRRTPSAVNATQRDDLDDLFGLERVG